MFRNDLAHGLQVDTRSDFISKQVLSPSHFSLFSMITALEVQIEYRIRLESRPWEKD